MKVFKDNFRFFYNFPITSNATITDADIIFTECGKIVDIYIQRLNNPPRFIYCFTDAVRIPGVFMPHTNLIVPDIHYKQLFDHKIRIYDIIPPPVPQGKPEQFRKLFLFTVDNYYFDMYAIGTFKKSKYFHLFTVSNNTEAFRKHMFCIYTNMSVVSDDLLLYEAMANGCIPITHRDVPGIHFKTTGKKIPYVVNLNKYLLDVPDLESFEEAIETAKNLTREEYEDLQAKVREFIGDTRYEERINTIRDFINMW